MDQHLRSILVIPGGLGCVPVQALHLWAWLPLRASATSSPSTVSLGWLQ